MSTHFYQSNGLAEEYVQLVKSLISKAKETDENPHFDMMWYRNIPPGNGLQSPVEPLCARKARSNLPMSHASKMQVEQAAGSTPQIDRQQAKAVKHTSKNEVQATRILLPASTHGMYKTTPSNLWHPDIITDMLQDSRSFIITAPDGATNRYARLHLESFKPYKLPTSHTYEVVTQRQATHNIQEHTKQVSTPTDQGT